MGGSGGLAGFVGGSLVAGSVVIWLCFVGFLGVFLVFSLCVGWCNILFPTCCAVWVLCAGFGGYFGVWVGVVAGGCARFRCVIVVLWRGVDWDLGLGLVV